MSSPIRPPLEITEADGSPTGRPINKIVVSDGTLSISGTTATITTGGAGGSGTVTSVSSSQAFITITDPSTTPSISIGNASAAATGVLTAADWTTFNSKGSGTIGGSSTANQISFGDTTANEITSSSNLQFLSSQNLYVAGRIQIGNATGTKLTTVSSQDLILDTNEGTDSGNITIQAGTNGQISITPDGTGIVKIDGVGINNSAIATGYILKATSTTEAGWVAESGGGFTGSLADTQVAFGNTTADSIQGSSDFTFGSNILKIGGASGSATFTSGGTGFTKIGVNGGSSSEAFIFIPSGTSGNLQLNAGGTGTASPLGVVQVGQSNMGVEISRAYTLPKVVTAANDYVLTAQTDGSTAWAAAGGGGGIGGSITDNQVAVGATTADEIEGSSDFTYNASTGRLVVAERISSSGTGALTLETNNGVSSGKIEILNAGVSNHINITPASGTLNLDAESIRLSQAGNTTITTAGTYDLTLNTNDGTNSGSIVIADGVNGQISITPNGSGLVEISGAYKLPSAVTSTDGFVLSCQTDGSTLWDSPHAISGTPSSATDTGKAGSIQYDSSYFYVCIATNTWRRVAISSW